MEYIKVGRDRYLVKDSNNLIVSGKDILDKEEENCPKNKKAKDYKDCKPKIDKKDELIDNEEPIKLDDNK